MNQVVALRTNRDYYDVREAAEYSLTVNELIDILSYYSGDTKVVFSNDNGYTYGVLSDNTVKNIRVRMNESLIGMSKLTGRELYDRIDEYLCDLEDSHVSRWYCDENQITIAASRNDVREVKRIMSDLGYKLYDSSANGEYVMLSYLINSGRPDRRMNESLSDYHYTSDEWDDDNNICYIFQLSKMVMFEVSYKRLRGNKSPHFSTVTQVFCKNKRDISCTGSDNLKNFPLAYEFEQKWNGERLHKLDVEKYDELLRDIEELKQEYNWEFTKSGDGFPFNREVELSKQKPKRRITPRR